MAIRRAVAFARVHGANQLALTHNLSERDFALHWFVGGSKCSMNHHNDTSAGKSLSKRHRTFCASKNLLTIMGNKINTAMARKPVVLRGSKPLRDCWPWLKRPGPQRNRFSPGAHFTEQHDDGKGKDTNEK